MIFIYLFGAVFLVTYIVGIIYAIIKRRFLDMCHIILMIPFFLFFIFSVMLGGNAAPEAVTSYEFYQEGCYYLVSHGDYTEVTYEVYHAMEILEKVGLTTMGMNFLWMTIRHIIKKKKEQDAIYSEKFAHKAKIDLKE